jgi:hypothetical protein
LVLGIGSAWRAEKAAEITQVLTDIAGGQLASLNWVIPSGGPSDHAGITDGSGPSWVALVLSAIGNSPYWANAAIIITWDDWGGFYNHVARPLILNSYELGFRVPLIVVSPYCETGIRLAPGQRVWQHFEIHRGDLCLVPGGSRCFSSLRGCVPGQHQRRSFRLFFDCFDFSQTPLRFQTIPAKYDAAQFLMIRARRPLLTMIND